MPTQQCAALFRVECRHIHQSRRREQVDGELVGEFVHQNGEAAGLDEEVKGLTGLCIEDVRQHVAH